ncbi:MAG: ABC transporter ATP-binding protein/permease [Roseburia sp.]|nr:ABC transporter ATP-binding protein/permease [Roseburia sp.]
MDKRKNYSIIKNIVYLTKESWLYDKRILIFSLISIVTGIFLPVFQIYLPKAAVDLFVQKAEVMQIAGTLAVLVGSLFVLQAVNGYVSSAKYFYFNDMRNVFLQKIFFASIDCDYSEAENGKSLEKYQRALNVVNQGDSGATSRFYQVVPQLVISFCCFFLYTGILSSLHVLVVVLLLLSSAVTYWFQKRETACYERTKDLFAKIQKKLYYCINCGRWAGKDIRVYHMQEWLTGLMKKWQGEGNKIRKERGRQEFYTHIMNCVLGFLRDSLAYVYLIMRTIQGEIGVGDFMLYFGAIVGFSNWIQQMVRQVSSLRTANVGVNDLREYLAVPPEDMKAGEEEMPDASGGVEIVFDHVTFYYPGSKEPTIRDLSFTIKKGEHVALVGLNGAGKTTLIKLMIGFYEPTSGQVRINGVDIRSLGKRDVYALYAAVFQDIAIFPFMLDENVALQPKTQIDRERVVEVLKKAGLWEELEEKGITPDSYMAKELTDEGVFLSGGQNQKLLLARALYKEAPVLLLDEPTASLDPLAEKEIYERYEEFCGGKTAVFISHRLASTQFSDRIFFMKDGTIAEVGTHWELMERGGDYADLYEVQSHYYNLSGEEGGEGNECYE